MNMGYTWSYAANYVSEHYNVKVDWENGSFQCPFCGYVVCKEHFEEHNNTLCPHCNGKEEE
jgi:Zn finger protein HypA/HybF involved in hydrogenase expression